MRPTIAAVATPPGSGALGIVRVSGPRAHELAANLTGVERFEPRRATFARAGDIDQVVVTFYPAESSPTGEDLVELTAHGSPLILRRLVEALGAEAAPAGEFTRRAYLAGKLDLAQAEAVCDLIRAGNDRARRAALWQLEGGLSRRVEELRAPVLELLVETEARLDHPEEDIAAPRDIRARVQAAMDSVRLLTSTFRAGALEAPRVCLVGRPNAGKSSLLNALLGRDRAIVSPEPGTTRDTLEEPWACAVLVDTAGLREAQSGVESEGVRRTRRALEKAEVAVLVIDGAREEDDEDRRAHDEVLAAGRPVVTVLAKADLPSRAAREGLRVSARSGDGLTLLSAELERALGGGEGALLTSARHRDALERAAEELEGALADADVEDRLASRLRGCLRALDEITGKQAPDEALHAVFSKFCVGK